jgi:hypothetical protein
MLAGTRRIYFLLTFGVWRDTVRLFCTTLTVSQSVRSEIINKGRHKILGTAVAQWLRYCATSQKVVGSIPDGVTGILHWHKSFWSHYGPGVDSISIRNEYQEYFLGGKCGRCVRLTILPPYCAVVRKSGNLNFLEPSGPLQACNGTA